MKNTIAGEEKCRFFSGQLSWLLIGCYCDSCEQRIHQLYGRAFDRLKFNTALIWMRFGEDGLKTIAIDTSYTLKHAKHTPYIGKIWPGSIAEMNREAIDSLPDISF